MTIIKGHIDNIVAYDGKVTDMRINPNIYNPSTDIKRYLLLVPQKLAIRPVEVAIGDEVIVDGIGGVGGQDLSVLSFRGLENRTTGKAYTSQRSSR